MKLDTVKTEISLNSCEEAQGSSEIYEKYILYSLWFQKERCWKFVNNFKTKISLKDSE